MEWLRPLARWCADGTAARLADEARDRSGLAVLDWLGAFYAGTEAPEATGYRQAAQMLAEGGAYTPAGEAWLSGCISHIAEVDDGHRLGMLHPGVVSVPPVMALAARRKVTVGQLRAAIAVGYELSVRVGAALGPAHYKKHHSTGTAGSFGAAAAVAAMLDSDEERFLSAFGHAGTQAAGLWQVLDDSAEAAKAAHVGHAVRNGFYAAALASAGVPGAGRVLEGPRGIGAAFGLAIDREALAPASSAGELALATATTKVWPVCGQMHHVLDAVQTLRARGFVPAEEIAEIRIESYAATKEIAGITDPRTPAQARFSTAFCTAALWLTGRISHTSLSMQALSEPEIGILARKVFLVEDPELTAGFPKRRAARVEIVTASGTRMAHTQEGRRGDPEWPLSRKEMDERFKAFAAAQPDDRQRAAREFAALVAEGEADKPLDPRIVSSLVLPAIHDIGKIK